MYLEVASSSDYKKLVINGIASQEQCISQWEKIIVKCNELHGGLDYVGYIDLMQGYAILLAEYNIVKSWLTKLWFKLDNEIVEKLIERGYNIITNKNNPAYNPDISVPKGSNVMSENYAFSLVQALKRSENLVTKLKMKSNEIALMIKDENPKQEISFDDIMASLLLRGIYAEENITLSRYMHLLKKINTQNKEQEQYG